MNQIILFIMLFFSIACQEKSKVINSVTHEPDRDTFTKHDTLKETREVDLSVIMGKFDPSQHKDFVKIDTKYADRAGLFLQKEVYDAYKNMHAAAIESGIDLVIRSATRNFDYQKGIWQRKWKANIQSQVGLSDKENALKILEYSSMPSTSRHHWGTDIDLNAFENSWFEKGEGLKLYTWLQNHAGPYGFCQVYSPKNSERPHGYNEEKWHWSYMPIASNYYNIAKQHMRDTLISGFEGSAVAKDIRVVEKYILGINKNCN